MFTFLCRLSAFYDMRSVMSQINEYDDDDDDDDDKIFRVPYLHDSATVIVHLLTLDSCVKRDNCLCVMTNGVKCCHVT